MIHVCSVWYASLLFILEALASSFCLIFYIYILVQGYKVRRIFSLLELHVRYDESDDVILLCIEEEQQHVA